MTAGLAKSTADSYLIENVSLWTTDGVTKNGQVWIEGGKFREAGVALSAPQHLQRIDGKGKVLMPSGVDAQTHLRVPGQAHKELPETGLLAALKGGYSAVLTMPNTQPTLDSVEILEVGRAQVKQWEEEFGVTVFWTAAITKKLDSSEITNFASLVKAGVRAFTNDGLGVMSDEVMDEAFARLENLGVPLLQHAEFLGHGGSLAPGPVQQKVKASPYPDEPEWKMVERDLRELRKHPKARYHVLHVSSARTLDYVTKAKKEDLYVTAEVTPHHLFFNTTTLDPRNTSFKMNPPIRGPEDQKALWKALADGTLDFVATDHAPHESLMKLGEFDKVAFGTIGLETTLGVLLSGLKKGYLNEARFVEVFASKPAAFLNLPSGFGSWHENAPFHATWFDADAPERECFADDFSSLSKNSCFIHAKLPGKVLGAFHGRNIYRFGS